MNQSTVTRIVSGIILILIVALCLKYSEWIPTAILIVGVLTLDEVYVNFLKLERWKLPYFSGYLSFILICFFAITKLYNTSIPWVLGLIFDALILINLFFLNFENKSILNFSKRFPFVAAIFLAFPFISLMSVMQFENLRIVFILLFLVNYGMDIGGWFFGKLLGKHKLWPEISPNKTLEGLIGGMILAGIAGQVFYYFAWGQWNWLCLLIFCLLGGISQLGDLAQSKLKRQCGIKDSSSLIPGHGGVYDRVDSLIFLGPLFFMLLSALKLIS